MNTSILNLGPQHPSTHGVLSLIVILHGEIIQWITTEIGLLHSGTEKLIECNYYCSSLPYFDRFDYVSTITQELLFVHALESLIACVSYIYCSVWSVLFCEFYSILNHCLAITTHAIDIGLFTTMLWSFEESENLISFSEVLSGTSIHSAFLLVGSLSYDISINWIDSIIYWLMHFVSNLNEIHSILSSNSLWSTSLYEVGMINSDFIVFFGLSGLLGRSCNINIDCSFSGYEFYVGLDYSIFIAYNGDCLDSYILRFNEMIESCRIIWAVLFVLVSFSFSFVSSSSSIVMELLILEFLVQLPFILSLINEFIFSIESSNGIYTIFIHSFPIISLNIVFNDYIVINQLNKFCNHINIGDLIAVLGSIDFVLGSVDLVWFYCLFFLFINY